MKSEPKKPKDAPAQRDLTEAEAKMVAELRRRPDQMASMLGNSLWRTSPHLSNNAYARQAGKMLRGLERRGIVMCKYVGPTTRWFLTSDKK